MKLVLQYLVKNIGSALMGYERYKEYEWRETFFASIYDLDRVERHEFGTQRI